MAKNDNLTDFLTDVANAIRDKKGTTDPINPQNFSDEIASIESGGGTSLINISLTLDGATNTITKGATITITDNTTGEEIVKTWEGSMIQVAVPSLAEYTIRCSKIIGYSSPKKVVFIPSKNVTYDYTFNYITPPVGVYLLTTYDDFIAPANWESHYECVGVFIGSSSKGLLPYKNYVLAPEVIDVSSYNVTKDNISAIRNKMREEAIAEYGDSITSPAELYCGYTNSRYAASADVFMEVWNYEFKNGAQAFMPSAYEMRLIAQNRDAIIAAYKAIGVTLPYTLSYTSIADWSIRPMHSSTPKSKTTTAGTITFTSYGWQCGESAGYAEFPSSLDPATTTIPFSAY